MRFQLVVQFARVEKNDLDRLFSLERALASKLSPSSEIDGHDFGSGEFNIFVFTDKPQATFDEVSAILSTEEIPGELRAAYRERDNDEYTVVWPPTLESFDVA